MNARRTVQELAQDAGVRLVSVRPLSAPSAPTTAATNDDRMQARSLLAERRKNRPDYKDPDKQLKRIFRSSKAKEKLDPNRWEFTQDEVDEALSTVINQPTTGAGLVQAFLDLGANVNLLQTSPDQAKPRKLHGTPARRSTVLQNAASMRRRESVSVLARHGADQVTLDEALKAALASKDVPCIEELLRYGADINKYPDALTDGVRTGNRKFVHLLLRAPKGLSVDSVSPCLTLAVQQKSEPMVSLLVGYGADPNYEDANAFKLALASDYQLAVAVVAGRVHISPTSLQGTLEIVMDSPRSERIPQYVELLLCCGLSTDNERLADVLLFAVRSNALTFIKRMLLYGVPPTVHESESIRIAMAESRWEVAYALLDSPMSPSQASSITTAVPPQAPHQHRFRILKLLIQKGADSAPLAKWVKVAIQENDEPLLSLLVNAGAPLENGMVESMMKKKDVRKLNLLLRTGGKGPEVHRALIDAIADSASRDFQLIESLVKHQASVDYEDGKALRLAVAQEDLPIIKLLCDAGPSTATVSAALPLAFRPNGQRRSRTFQVLELLLSKDPSNEGASTVLRMAIQGGAENLDVVNLVLSRNPKLLGVALATALALENNTTKLPVLAALLQSGIAQDILDQTLTAEIFNAFKQNDLTVVKLLLDEGASADYEDGEALKVAATAGHPQLVRVLLNSKQKPAAATSTAAFRALFHDPSANRSRNAFGIAKELLHFGVHQPAIDAALRTTLDELNWNTDSSELVDVLLHYKANVNTADGTCFTFAARQHEFELFSKLLAHGPDYGVIISCLLGSKLDEKSLVAALKLCFDDYLRSGKQELPESFKGLKYPLLAAAILNYPRGVNLVDLLLAHGLNPDITTLYVLDEAVDVENVPVLLWSLARPQKLVSDSVILALLHAGASPNRRSSGSEMTPLMLAAREGRTEIVKELISRGADVSARDKRNHSPLFYASSNSVTPIVQFLCQAKALKDDGSLQEASRSLQSDIVSELLQHGHNSNCPSRLHGGRNALGEVCLGANVTDSTQKSKLRHLIRLLLDSKANPKFQARNEKSAIMLALDNPFNPLEVTEALLETEVWEDINDEKHMYRNRNGVHYSPVKYAELVPSIARQQHKQELLELLLDKGCEKRYYSDTPEQPEGAIGLPSSIVRLADRYKEHKLALQLAAEADEQARILAEAQHRDALRRKQEEADADQHALAAMQAKQVQLDQARHEFELNRLAQAEATKRAERDKNHILQQKHERENSDQRQQLEDRRQAAALYHEGNLIQQRQAEIDFRARTERGVLKDKEEAFKRNMERQRMLTERMDESAKLHAKVRQPAQQQLEWGNVD